MKKDAGEGSKNQFTHDNAGYDDGFVLQPKQNRQPSKHSSSWVRFVLPAYPLSINVEPKWLGEMSLEIIIGTQVEDDSHKDSRNSSGDSEM